MKKLLFLAAGLGFALVGASVAKFAFAGGDPIPKCSTNVVATVPGAADCPVFTVDWSLGPIAFSTAAARHPIGSAKLEGVPGGDVRPTGEIDVLSFNWGISAPRPSTIGGGGGVGPTAFQDFSIVKMIDKASPVLAEACASGRLIRSAQIDIFRPRSTPPRDYMSYTLTDTLCTLDKHGATGAPNSVPLESVSFSYGKIQLTYTESNGTKTTRCWDLRRNAGCGL